jgi:TPR repeat protein
MQELSSAKPLPSSAGLWLKLFGPWLRYRLKAARDNRRLDRLVRLARRLARLGDADAQFILGRCYSTGTSVVRNLPEAVLWLRRSAEQGHVEAMYFLGMIYLTGPTVAEQDELSPARYYGDDEAANAGLLFPAGVTVTTDLDQAALWFGRAAEKGHLDAMYQMAFRYANGEGVAQDSAKAVELFRACCERELPEAHFVLGNILANGQHGQERDLEAAMDHLEFAARHDHLHAAFQLGSMLILPGMPRQDAKQAEHWLTSAGQRGHVQAMTLLARLYADDTLVPRDDVRAAAWFRKAAGQGDAVAQWRLGILFHHGRGVEKDAYEAAHWYEKAGHQGVVQAQVALAMLYRMGQGVLRNDARAAEWFAQAAAGGDVRAMINLALLKLMGTVGERDPVEADRLFSMAESASTDPGVLAEIAKFREVHKVAKAAPAAATGS